MLLKLKIKYRKNKNNVTIRSISIFIITHDNRLYTYLSSNQH